MFQPEIEDEASLPIFAAFSDVLACVLGIFVLFFVWVVSIEANMASELEHERVERAAERVARAAADDRLRKLESALAGPLSQGLITFAGGTIGIRGSVLFDVNSADLRRDGESLLRELAAPLSTYLSSRDEVLMVSGFTDDLPIRVSPQSPYHDNWELSVHRSLTVVRALIAAGMPAAALFAAGFGENHPVATNDNEQSRAKNRRVELAPVVRPRQRDLQASQPGGSG